MYIISGVVTLEKARVNYKTHCAGEEKESQRGEVICPRSHSQEILHQGLSLGVSDARFEGPCQCTTIVSVSLEVSKPSTLALGRHIEVLSALTGWI